MSDPGYANSSCESTPKTQLRTASNTPSPAAGYGEPIPQLVKLSKSKGASILEKYYVKIGGMFFQTFDDARNAMDHAQWSPPMNDPTIPQTAEQDRAIVNLLVEAFMNTDTALDTEGNAYRKRLTPGTNVFYEPWTVEACAWEILRMVKEIHTTGFNAPIYDSDILKAIGQTENWTFEDRINMICRVLKISKSIAVTLMKQEKVWTTIGAPHKLYNSTMVNAASNANRNKWVKAGREAEKGPPAGLRIPKPRGSTSKRQRLNNAPAVASHYDSIHSPKSLAALYLKYNIKAPASLDALEPSSPLSNTSNSNDVEMVDADPDEPTVDTTAQDKTSTSIIDETPNNMNDNTAINTRDKHKVTFANTTNPPIEIKDELSLLTSPNSTTTTTTRNSTGAAADVEAAHALLGFGRTSRVT